MISRDIEGYEGLYKVYEDGKIWSYPKPCSSSNGLFLKQGYLRGYTHVVLNKDRKRKTKTVHRIVAETFIQNTENKPCVNHINGIKDDNRVENLEWTTHSENAIHSYRVLGKKPNTPSKGRFGKNNHRSKEVVGLNKDMNIIYEFDSIADAVRVIGVDQSRISYCCKHHTSLHKGLYWRFKKDILC